MPELNTPAADPAPPPAAPTRSDDTLPHAAELTERGPSAFLSPPAAAGDLGRLGDYRVVTLLGEGGMRFVFRGEDDALRRPVALKVMRPEVAARANARERFLREGRVAAVVKSDHVTVIHHVGEANGVPFLAMEYLDGATLDDWLKARKGPVPPAAVLKVAKDVLRRLAAAHDKGLVHRDIKPANLWVERGTGRVKVLDFGLTRPQDGAEALTQEGTVMGTPSYMAPEQAAGKPVDGRADLFSLGVVLYRMLLGRSPFQRDGVLPTLGAVMYDTPASAATRSAELPAALASLIDRLMAKAPADRPATAKAALTELLQSEKQMRDAAALPASMPVVFAPPAAADPWTDIVTEPAAKPASAPPTKRRPWVRIGAAFAFALAAVAGVIVIKIRNKDGTETEIKVPDTATVTVTKDGKEVGQFGPEAKKEESKKAVPPPALTDRDRVEALVKVGKGTFLVLTADGKILELKKGSVPPAGHFNLVHAMFGGTGLRDDELALIKDSRSLARLTLNSEPLITDAGLMAVGELPVLSHLELDDTTIGDEGMKALAGFPNLTILHTNSTKITAVGLQHLRHCPKLISIDHSYAGSDGHIYISADKLKAIVANCNRLRHIGILQHDAKMSLAPLLGLKELRNIDCFGDVLTDDNCAILAKIPLIEDLYIRHPILNRMDRLAALDGRVKILRLG